MTLEEIKIRQLTNQHLIEKADKLTVVKDLCGVQAQFLGNAIHSLRIRCDDFDEETVADGLVKNWTIRSTVHVFAEEDLPLFIHCNNGDDYRKDEWNGYHTWQRPDGSYNWYDDGGCQRVWALSPERQKYFSNIIVEAVKNSPRSRDELKEVCLKNGASQIELLSMFDSWGGGIADLCKHGFLNYVVQEKKAYTVSPHFTPIPYEEARLEMARRYFTNVAPATIKDAAYFFGVNQTQVKKWLSDLPVKSVDCNGKTYFYIENGKSYDKEIPKCLLLAGFDQLMLGYQKKESIYLPEEHLRKIFNLAGIVMPSILLDGKVVGKWKKKDKTFSFELFESISENDLDSIKNTAMELWDDIKKIKAEG